LDGDDKRVWHFSIESSNETIRIIEEVVKQVDNELKVTIHNTDNPKSCKALFQSNLRDDEKENVKTLCKFKGVQCKEYQPHVLVRVGNIILNFIRKTFLIGIIIALTETIFLLYRYLLDIALHDKYNLLIELANEEKIPESLTSETYLHIGFVIVAASTLIGMIADYMHNKKK
jgi:hypothetical protein